MRWGSWPSPGEGATPPRPSLLRGSMRLRPPGIWFLEGRGMVASGGLSPLLGGLYLVGLDQAMDRLKSRSQLVEYVRYMDDVVLLAKTRWQLRRAIAALLFQWVVGTWPAADPRVGIKRPRRSAACRSTPSRSSPPARRAHSQSSRGGAPPAPPLLDPLMLVAGCTCGVA